METGEFLTRWTVRVALALFVVALLLRLRAARRRSRLAQARLAWTVGCAAFLLHVVCAFEFYHHWSHAAAYAATARQTAAVVGWNWGGGIYANYLFALLWVADGLWWWRGLEACEMREPYVAWKVPAFMLFIAFNATVVFGQGPIRWFGLAAGALLLLALVGRSRAPAGQI